MVSTLLVAEPERDDGGVDAGVQQAASRWCAAAMCAVTVLGVQRRAAVGGRSRRSG